MPHEFVQPQHSLLNTAPGVARELPPLYYLDNFLTLIHSVYQLYDDLLTAEELDFYQRILRLSENAQALFVRLLSRRRNLFRVSKLRYSEISHLPKAIHELNAARFIGDASLAPFGELFALFTKNEWLTFIQKQHLKNLRKEQLIPHLEAIATADHLGQAITLSLNESLIYLTADTPFTTFSLLYFGNGRQSLTDFILRDLGLFRYEQYSVHKHKRLFRNRAEIESMLFYYRMCELLESNHPSNKEQLIAFYLSLPPLAATPINADTSRSIIERSIDRRMQRLRLSIARQLERLDAREAACEIYQECTLAPSRERLARLYKTQGRIDQALAICDQILQKGSEAEKAFAHQFSSRLRKTPTGSVRFRLPHQTLQLPLQKGVRVEQHLVTWLSSTGQCFYVENRLFLGIFGLVFWPVLFADIQGAFTHAFQSAPHDVYHEEFLCSRAEHLAEAWQNLRQWTHNPEKIMPFIKAKHGIANRFVHWETLNNTLILQALRRIPLAHWQAVFNRLWQDLRENCSGLPDLIYFPNKSGYELIEVKGPGDRLQKNQQRWLEYFASNKMPFRIIHVDWQQQPHY